MLREGYKWKQINCPLDSCFLVWYANVPSNAVGLNGFSISMRRLSLIRACWGWFKYHHLTTIDGDHVSWCQDQRHASMYSTSYLSGTFLLHWILICPKCCSVNKWMAVYRRIDAKPEIPEIWLVFFSWIPVQKNRFRSLDFVPKWT